MPKIIVVSVSPSHHQNIQAWLKAGYSVMALATVKQLEVEMMAAGRHDLILLDVFLPGKNGFEACHEIKKNDRFKMMPIILCLEPDHGEGDKFWARQQGASGVLVKPFKEEDLLAMVEHNLPPG
jgi:DNA-binding response OmpR family regulator